MNTSEDNIENKRAQDPIDQLIYEMKFRIQMVVPVKEQDALIVFINNGINITLKLSSFPRLRNATKEELNNWTLISGGIGIEWPAIDEDLSLKGLLKQYATQNIVTLLTGKAGENTFGMAA